MYELGLSSLLFSLLIYHPDWKARQCVCFSSFYICQSKISHCVCTWWYFITLYWSKWITVYFKSSSFSSSAVALPPAGFLKRFIWPGLLLTSLTTNLLFACVYVYHRWGWAGARPSAISSWRAQRGASASVACAQNWSSLSSLGIHGPCTPPPPPPRVVGKTTSAGDRLNSWVCRCSSYTNTRRFLKTWNSSSQLFRSVLWNVQ